jgi:thiopurine S-methyltransferase
VTNKLWKTRWKNNDIAFHQPHSNPLLAQYLPELHLQNNDRILVPLCGKSHDMDFLADAGHPVLGIELSKIAIQGWFDHRKVNPTRHQQGPFTCWRHRQTEIWCGDIFDLTRLQLKNIRLVYDCASLSAFPADIRPNYVRHFQQNLPATSQILLITTESPDDLRIDSSHHIDSEVQSLYEGYYHIELLHGQKRFCQDPEQPDAAHTEMEEKVYLMTNDRQFSNPQP